MVIARAGTAGADGFGRDVDERPGAARSQHDWQVHSVARAAAERAVLHDVGEAAGPQAASERGHGGPGRYRNRRGRQSLPHAAGRGVARGRAKRAGRANFGRAPGTRELAGRAGAATMLAPQEPEAVVQPTKHGLLRPSYKPSALHHESGLVIAQAVHASSETAVVTGLLQQHRAVFAVEPRRLLGDAGYHTLELLSEFAAREIDVLIPAGRTYAQPPWEKRQAKRKLPKSAFRYEAEADVYHCPGQRILARAGGDRDRHGRRYVRYRGDCRGCALRDHCTKSKASRVLKRYAGEEIKRGAMAAVLQQPAALRQLRRRGAIIEPLWADLRERQRLTRFHRRGLAKVKLEFALHCAAYNLRKVAVGAGLALLFTLSIRSAHRRQLVAIGLDHFTIAALI